MVAVLALVGVVHAMFGDEGALPAVRFAGGEQAAPPGVVTPTTGVSTTTTIPERAAETIPLELTVEGIEVRSPGGAVEKLPKTTRTAVLATVEQYVRAAILRPLITTTADDERLLPLFSEKIQPLLSGPDRRTLVDEGLPRAVGGVSVERAQVRLVALGNEDGDIELVTATVDLVVQAETIDGPMTVVRSGDLVLVPAGKQFVVDGYRLSVRRESGGGAVVEAGV